MSDERKTAEALAEKYNLCPFVKREHEGSEYYAWITRFMLASSLTQETKTEEEPIVSNAELIAFYYRSCAHSKDDYTQEDFAPLNDCVRHYILNKCQPVSSSPDKKPENVQIIEELGNIGNADKKPLREITDEDAIQIAKFATHVEDKDSWKVVQIERSGDYVRVYFDDKWILDKRCAHFVKVAPFPMQGVFVTDREYNIVNQLHYQFPHHAYQYLQHLGYELPVFYPKQEGWSHE